MFAFTPISAPYKATVFPLLQRAELDAPATAIAARLRAAGLSTKIDTTSACGCTARFHEIVCTSKVATVVQTSLRARQVSHQPILVANSDCEVMNWVHALGIHVDSGSDDSIKDRSVISIEISS